MRYPDGSGLTAEETQAPRSAAVLFTAGQVSSFLDGFLADTRLDLTPSVTPMLLFVRRFAGGLWCRERADHQFGADSGRAPNVMDDNQLCGGCISAGNGVQHEQFPYRAGG